MFCLRNTSFAVVELFLACFNFRCRDNDTLPQQHSFKVRWVAEKKREGREIMLGVAGCCHGKGQTRGTITGGRWGGGGRRSLRPAIDSGDVRVCLLSTLPAPAREGGRGRPRHPSLTTQKVAPSLRLPSPFSRHHCKCLGRRHRLTQGQQLVADLSLSLSHTHTHARARTQDTMKS